MERLNKPYNLHEETAGIKQQMDDIDPTAKDAPERIASLDALCANIFRDLVDNNDEYRKKLGEGFEPAIKELNAVCGPIYQTAIENSDRHMKHVKDLRRQQAEELRKMGYRV